MARRRRGNSTTHSGERDHFTTLNRSLHLERLLDDVLPPVGNLPTLTNVNPRDPVARLTDIEDRRLFHPEQRTLPGTPVRGTRHWQTRVLYTPRKSPAAVGPKRAGHLVTRPQLSLPRHSSYRFRFESPQFVGVCVRRTNRRQVLFALKRTGKGSRAPKRHYNENSSTYCR